MLQRITDLVNEVVVEAGGEPLTGEEVIALIGEHDGSGRYGVVAVRVALCFVYQPAWGICFAGRAWSNQ